MCFTSQDIERAQEVQNAALPIALPPVVGLEIATRVHSAGVLGGDFHLIINPTTKHTPSPRVGLVVGDVSGKGLPASLTATSIGHLLPWLDPLRDPRQALRALNRELLERTPPESFASLVLAETDLREETLRVWSVGHPPALLWHAATGAVQVAGMGDLPMGCFPDWQGKPQEWAWASGDVLVLYSDGLIEVRDAKGEMFGIEGVAETLRTCANSLPDDSNAADFIATALMEAATVWGGVTDDVTLLVCRRASVMYPTDSVSHSVRVVLVDDHGIWRDGMRALLDDTEFDVVGEAASGKEALDVVQRTVPDLVLLDIRMAGGNGFEALEALHQHASQTKVVMLTTYDNPHYKARALVGGATGYLLKGMSRDEMLEALRDVFRGTPATPAHKPQASRRSAAAASDEVEAEDLITPLTIREVEVLTLLSTGLCNHEIGERLYISEGTVKSHIEHIISKLGVSDRVQAAVWAARQGIAPTPAVLTDSH